MHHWWSYTVKHQLIYSVINYIFIYKKIVNGGDLKADIIIHDPNKQEIHKQLDSSATWFDLIIKTEGKISN